MAIGHRLRKARKELGYSQKLVAEKLGITDVTYSRYELDKRQPSFETLEELAKIFNIDVVFFFEREVDDARNELDKEISEHLKNQQELYDNIRSFSHFFDNPPNEDIAEIVNDLKKEYYEMQLDLINLIERMKMIDLYELLHGKQQIHEVIIDN